MKVAEAIRMKRAVRAFVGQPLPREAVLAILDAGRRAQSSKNTQPWDFIAVEDPGVLQGLSRTGTYAGHLAGASLAIVIVTPNPEARWSILFDAGQAAAYMQLAAWERGIGSCLATIYDPPAAQAILGVPSDRHIQVAISFGVPSDPKELTDPPRPGGRRPGAEVFHFNRWGTSLA
ncbi:MAG TPA: nitroreductase family protein [Anaerolineales bacterium]|nr:nitroreductase family protein [Anaerolineales bacterium]